MPELRLTPREAEVLRLLALGETQVTAAQRLERSLWTIKDQTKKARGKLGARTHTQAVAIAIRLELI